MGLKYIYDENGDKESVIIPIKVWENLQQTDNSNLAKKIDFDPANYKGFLSHLKEDAKEVIDKMRNEWTRDI